MQKQFLPLLSFIVLAFLFMTGCDKEDAPPAPTKTQLITQSSWKFEKAMASGFDVSGQVNACFKDNIATFNSSGTMTLDESTTVCTPTSYAGSYTWSFQNSETVLHLSAPIFTGGSSDFTLVSLNSTNLVVSQVMTVGANPPTTVEVTFKH
jgi:hypothetical protein